MVHQILVKDSSEQKRLLEEITSYSRRLSDDPSKDNSFYLTQLSFLDYRQIDQSEDHFERAHILTISPIMKKPYFGRTMPIWILAKIALTDKTENENDAQLKPIETIHKYELLPILLKHNSFLVDLP